MSRKADRRARGWGHLPVPDDFGFDYEGTRAWQAALGLTMTPDERLTWLEETVAEMRDLLGRAAASPDPDGERDG